MFRRVFVVAFNTYRESVRARVMHGLVLLAVGSAVYSAVVGEFALGSRARVVSDLGAASISIFALIVAIVIGATSLHREVELKTVFPILARPIHRGEYVVGKYLGILLTLAVFVLGNVALLLVSLSFMTAAPWYRTILPLIVSVAASGLLAWRFARLRLVLPIVATGVIFVFSWFGADDVLLDRRVIVASAWLTMCEVSIVSALASLFASFSSPFLSAVFTFSVVIVGRSADTLAKLPERVFGQGIHNAGEAVSYVVPNLMVYLPPRPVLAGESSDVTLSQYLVDGTAQALAWSVLLLVVSGVVFRRRDFL